MGSAQADQQTFSEAFADPVGQLNADPEPQETGSGEGEGGHGGDVGKDTQTGDQTAAPAGGAQTQQTTDEPWTKKAALEERRKRQAVERELRDMQQKVAYLEGRVSSAPAHAEPAEEIDYDDLPGSIDRLAKKRLNAFQKQQQEREEQQWNATVADCLEDLRERHEDADEVIQQYVRMERQNPRLAARIRRQADPAQWAYEYAKKRLESGSEKAQLEKRIAELEAQIRGEAGEGQKQGKPKQRRSLGNAPGASGHKGGPALETQEEAFKDAFSREY